MKLRTELKFEKQNFSIDLKDNLFFMGSCFSENINLRLVERKFQTVCNPFGVVYNPISIFKNLNNIIDQKFIEKNELVLKDEVWNSFDHHSDMSSDIDIEVLKNINEKISVCASFLEKTNHLFITFGTAWVYEFGGNIVANCHKFPRNKFNKRLLSVDEIEESAKKLIEKMLLNNSELNIVFTISPVRHLKDGFIENNQSKGTLHLAIKELCQEFKNVSYFPAYEYVLDDLRDYRFFKEDFVHPNKMAIDYIMEKFEGCFFKENTKSIIEKIDKLNQSLNHKVQYPNSKSYQLFQKQVIQQIEELKKHDIHFELPKF